MKHHRGHWNRGAWTRKTSLVEAADSSLVLKNSSMRNVGKDESSAWEETVRVEDSGSGWDLKAFDEAFFDDNKKIFQWDDSGASDYLRKAEAKLQQGIRSVYADYLHESNEFSASIDWDGRWLCTLPDCAENLVNREEKIKNPKVNSTRRDPSDNSSAVIVGLPEPQNDTGCSGTPSIHLPLNFVPLPTGWGEGEDNQAGTGWEDSPMQPSTATNPKDIQGESTSQSWHAATNNSEVLITGSGWPEQPNSYQHIIPSGWEDVQPVLSSGWEGGDREPRSDIHMHQADIRWGDHPSYGSRPAWGNPHVSAESHQIYGKSPTGKQQDFYNKSHKYGYWRPKRGSETNSYELNGRKSMQRPGRPISTIHRVNHDPRSPRINRSDRSKAQWPTVDTTTHE